MPENQPRRGYTIWVPSPAFEPGGIMATRGVMDLVREDHDFDDFMRKSLERHLKGDWGELGSEDKAANQLALKQGERLLSSYKDDRFPGHGVATLWIITEADRSLTTILFPDEY